MSCGSRVPVHSVTVEVPSRSQAPASTPRRRNPSRRTSLSGWIMLKVPETATRAIWRPAAATLTRSARDGAISSGKGDSPATDMLNCVSRRLWVAKASKTPSGDERVNVLAKTPMCTSDATFHFGKPHGLAGLC